MYSSLARVLQYLPIYHQQSTTNSGSRCDRIQWYGEGIHQKSYTRWESRFSDHRPVCAMFLIFLHNQRCVIGNTISFSQH
ncbi:putative inositol-polyphosphate 5-phosphatase [Helianthus anomalus]